MSKTPDYSTTLPSSTAQLIVGQRIYSVLYGGRYGVVFAIHGEQSPQTVKQLGGGVGVMGGRAHFDIVFDDGTRSKQLPEGILRGVQWTIYADVADREEIDNLLKNADHHENEERIKAEEASAARLARKEQIKQENPHLEQVADGCCASATLASRNIRKELKQHFPGVKFSVVSRTRRTDAIDISWTDGPTLAEVEKVTGKYQEGHFNGMEDIYEYDRDNVWPDVFGGARYVCESRELSDEVMEAAAQELIDTWSTWANVPLKPGQAPLQQVLSQSVIDNAHYMTLGSEARKLLGSRSFYKPQHVVESRAAEKRAPAESVFRGTPPLGETTAGPLWGEPITHITGRGRTLTGYLRTDITQDQARDIDPYTFRKSGGFFIRAARREEWEARQNFNPADPFADTPVDEDDDRLEMRA